MKRPSEPWLSLLGPLPVEAVPRVSPIGRGEMPQDPTSPIHGWKDLIVEIGTGDQCYRIVHVLVDADGGLLSGSDHIVYRSETGPGGESEQFSIGGRFEPDGTFNGTRWHVVGPEPIDDDQPNWNYTPRKPTAEEIAALRELVGEVLKRGGYQ